MIDQHRAHIAGSGDDVHDTGRKISIGNDLSQHQDRQRCGFGWLDYHGVSGSQRWRDLPGGHQEWKIPRDDLTGDTKRLRCWPQAQVLELVRPASVIEEVLRRCGHVEIARFLDRLAVVERLHHGKLPGPLGDRPGDPEQIFATLRTRHG
jgi:hypothetical protein